MTTTATHNEYAITTERVLFMAFELSENTWKLGFTTGPGQKPRERAVAARDQGRLLQEIAQAKRRFGLPESAPVVSCYEAGREGFWLHRFLQAQGIINHVVDSSSIEVNRRKRRAKSDALDVRKLLSMLMRYEEGVSNLLICYSICEAKTFHMMEGHDDHPGVALPLLPRDRHRPAWYVV